MKKLKVMLAICISMLIFLTGFMANYALNHVYIDKESPFLIGFSSANQPGNWINEKNIQVYDDRIVIKIDNARISRYEATGSMLPVLGENANGIEIVPFSSNQIQIGDIITFQKGEKLIVHRVIEKGKDNKGDYFITKGDNNDEADGRVYFSQIKYVTIGLVY